MRRAAGGGAAGGASLMSAFNLICSVVAILSCTIAGEEGDGELVRRAAGGGAAGGGARQPVAVPARGDVLCQRPLLGQPVLLPHGAPPGARGLLPPVATPKSFHVKQPMVLADTAGLRDAPKLALPVSRGLPATTGPSTRWAAEVAACAVQSVRLHQAVFCLVDV